MGKLLRCCCAAVLLLCLMLLGTAVQAEYLYQADLPVVRLELAMKPTGSDPVDEVEIYFKRTENVSQQSSSVSYYLTELISPNGHTISPSNFRVQIDGDLNPRKMGNGAMFTLSGTEQFVKLQLLPGAWGPAGVYTGWLVPVNGTGPSIEIIVEIAPYQALGVESGSKVIINADSGPAVYHNRDQSLRLVVDANHPNWKLSVSTPGLKDDGNSDQEFMIKPDQISISVKGDAGQILRKSGSSFTIEGSGYSSEIFELEVAVELGWEHRAGVYTGVIHFVLEPNS